jgi:hypothetical protein
MDRRQKQDLDNHITGHYGEDQLQEEEMDIWTERLQEATDWAEEHEEMVVNMAGTVHHRLELTNKGVRLWTHCRQFANSYECTKAQVEDANFNILLSHLAQQHDDMLDYVKDKENRSPTDPTTWGPMYCRLKALVDEMEKMGLGHGLQSLIDAKEELRSLEETAA